MSQGLRAHNFSKFPKYLKDICKVLGIIPYSICIRLSSVRILHLLLGVYGPYQNMRWIGYLNLTGGLYDGRDLALTDARSAQAQTHHMNRGKLVQREVIDNNSGGGKTVVKVACLFSCVVLRCGLVDACQIR